VTVAVTQESPVRLCYDCRTPLKEPAGTVNGEPYCADCLTDAVARAYNHD
jgi:hypothetical protein